MLPKSVDAAQPGEATPADRPPLRGRRIERAAARDIGTADVPTPTIAERVGARAVLPGAAPQASASAEDLGREQDLAPSSASPRENASALGAKLILILGAPRSGTTWLAKIFDSHPAVLYRHEPDAILHSAELPLICHQQDLEKFREIACDYLLRLANASTLETAGTLPIFEKEFLSPMRQRVRTGIIRGLRAIQPHGSRPRFLRHVRIPDLLGGEPHPDLRIVVKSVMARGRAGFFAELAPASRIIVVLRHPCGHVASMVRGLEFGQFHRRARIDEVLNTEQIGQFGLSHKKLMAMPAIDQYAWAWALLCQKALDDLKGKSNAQIVRYDDLCADPVTLAHELFAFAALPWCEQTANFIRESTHYEGPDEFGGVMRMTSGIADRWRTELSAADQARIISIARQFEVGRRYVQ